MSTTAHDEAGNVIAIDPGSTVGQLAMFLEWCRAKDYQVGPFVKLDGLVVQIQDMRQARKYGPPAPVPDGDWMKTVGYDPDKEGG